MNPRLDTPVTRNPQRPTTIPTPRRTGVFPGWGIRL
jgi:hypothetical protein